MKTTEYFPAEPLGRRAFNVGQASHLPSTHGRDGSPQPSLESPSTRASRRSAPTIADQKICSTPCVSASVPSVSFDSVAPASSPFGPICDCSISRLPRRSVVVKSSAFSLVELLVVMAIIGMMVGLSALAVSGMRAPALQHAADQVMSGFSLARQLAITKNTEAALLVATNTGANLPSEPYRYWSVVYSNKSAGTWSFAKDWEALPNGAVFLEILRYSDYSRTNAASQPFTNSVGQPFQPTNFVSGNFTIVSGNSTINNNGTFAYSKFNSSGSVGGGLNGPAVIRIVDGTVMNGNVTLTSTNRYYFLEINYMTGRIRMKSRENYINN